MCLSGMGQWKFHVGNKEPDPLANLHQMIELQITLPLKCGYTTPKCQDSWLKCLCHLAQLLYTSKRGKQFICGLYLDNKMLGETPW